MILSVDFREPVATPPPLRFLWRYKPSTWLISGNPDTVERPTEAEAIVNAYDDAVLMFRAIATPNEVMDEVRTLVQYAYENSIGAAKLIEKALGFSESYAYELVVKCGIERRDKNENASEFPLYSRVKLYDESAIKRYVAAIIKPCPNHNHSPHCEKTTRASNELCYSCRQIYMTREEMPEWLRWVVKQDNAEYRKQAIEALYHAELIEEAS